MSPGRTDADTSSLPADVFDGSVPDDIEEALIEIHGEMVEMLDERQSLLDALDPFKYVSRDASTNGLENVLSEELKYASRVSGIAFESRHDIEQLSLRKSEESDDWLLSARLKMRESTGDGDYEWKRDDDDNGIVRRWIDLYRFPVDLVDEGRLKKYEVVLKNYDEFANKSPKNGYPGGKTRTVKNKLERSDLPMVDDANLTPYFDLQDEIAKLESEIKRLYNSIDDIVYQMYDLSDDEIETVEDENGIGLKLK